LAESAPDEAVVAYLTNSEFLLRTLNLIPDHARTRPSADPASAIGPARMSRPWVTILEGSSEEAKE
jgi:hypothetical protein